MTSTLESPSFSSSSVISLIQDSKTLAMQNPLYAQVLRHLEITKDDYSFTCGEEQALEILRFGVLQDLQSAKDILSHFRQRGFEKRVAPLLYFDVNIELDPPLYSCRTNCNENRSQDEIVHAVSRVILKDPIITHLSLNGLRVANANFHPLSQALQTNKLLQQISLVQCTLPAHTLIHLTEALTGHPTITSLSIENCPSISTVDIESIFNLVSKSEKLQKLTLKGLCDVVMMEPVTDDSDEHPPVHALIRDALIHNTSLTSLEISQMCNHQVANSIGTALLRNSTLEELRLDGNAFSGGIKGLTGALKVNSTLTVLHLNNSSVSFDDAMIILESLSTGSLTAIDLANNNITSIHMPWLEAIVMNNPSLTRLHLEDLSDLVITILKRNPHNLRLKNLTLFEALSPLLEIYDNDASS
jgi:hypothetical protein